MMGHTTATESLHLESAETHIFYTLLELFQSKITELYSVSEKKNVWLESWLVTVQIKL